MDTEEYSDKQLNYFRLCHIFTDEVAGSLRLFFKKEWDRLHKRKWKDGREAGEEFYRGESLYNQGKNKEHLEIMVKGNTAEWDCTKLFYAICYSDCISWELKTAHKKALEKLRKARNEFYSHVPRGEFDGAEFECIIKEVEDALLDLGLSRKKIRVIREQTSFPTKELNKVLAKVKSLEQEKKVLEAQLRKEISSFCVLPPKPSHEVADRDREVAEIAKQLKELKKANENRLSYLYISGNPGSGKSQLAGLVAKRYSDVVNAIPNYTLFVMTVNAESPSTLLESYVSLARKLKCPEYAITNTLKSPHLKSEEKIAHMKSLIGTNVELYTTWLLVVDNVKSISKIHAYLPESGNEQWARGQLLITTQDSASVPPMSPCVNHVSVSKGMEPHDAVYLLEKVSGISGLETEEVARRFDYQPLSLVEAAAYVRKVRVGWGDYIEKLKEGRIVATDTIVVDPVYPKSMGEVRRLAVKEAIESTNVIIKNIFTLLFFCAPQPLNLEIVTNYIRNRAVKRNDEDAIRLEIQKCSLLLFDQEENACFIRTHQVTHDAIRAVLKDYLKADKSVAMKAALKSLYQFTGDIRLHDHLSSSDTFAKHFQSIPHIKSLVTQIKDIFSVEETRNALEIANYLETLGVNCVEHFAYQAAKDCFENVLKIRRENLGPDDLDVGRTYHYLGNAQIGLQERKEAEENLDSALRILLEKLGPGDLEVGVTYSDLGDVHQHLYQRRVNFDQAKKYYDCALRIFKEELKPGDYVIGEAYMNLGDVSKKLCKLNQAKEYYDLALPILLGNPRDGYTDIAKTYHNLGEVHKDLGEVHRNLDKLDQAKDCYDLALHILRKESGTQHCLFEMIGKSLVEIEQLQENWGGFGKRPTDSGHPGSVPAKRSKKM